MAKELSLSGVEQFFDEDELIVSKTNLKGHITYCNDVFLRVAGYTEQECIGQPHAMIRHPDMPRAIFALLWETIQNGDEIFAYVVNRCKNGDHYWVNAHVTPSRDAHGNVVGFHSNRRVPDRSILDNHIRPLYASLLKTERANANRKDGLAASLEQVKAFLAEKGMAYDRFVLTLAA